VAAKVATTIDGRIATRTGLSQWITGEAARADVHRWRRLFPAIGVGAGTVMTDNPRLTARVAGEPEWCPIRFVFDGRLRSVLDHRLPTVYSDEFAARTIVVTTQHAGLGYVRKLRSLGCRCLGVRVPERQVPLAQFRARCAEEKVGGVLLEGGAQLLSRALIVAPGRLFFRVPGALLFADEKAKPALSG